MAAYLFDDRLRGLELDVETLNNSVAGRLTEIIGLQGRVSRLEGAIEEIKKAEPEPKPVVADIRLEQESVPRQRWSCKIRIGSRVVAEGIIGAIGREHAMEWAKSRAEEEGATQMRWDITLAGPEKPKEAVLRVSKNLADATIRLEIDGEILHWGTCDARALDMAIGWRVREAMKLGCKAIKIEETP